MAIKKIPDTFIIVSRVGNLENVFSDVSTYNCKNKINVLHNIIIKQRVITKTINTILKTIKRQL